MNEQTTPPPTPKKQRTRSPAYPAIDLKDAIGRATKMWEENTRHWAAADTVVKFWGYEKNSSGGASVLSALMKFGLLEDRGSGDKREVKLTESAIGLVFNADTNSSEHKVALRKAALLPAIHAELWKKFDGSLPHDTVLERYLVVDRGFNTAYVKCFIKQFRRTILFADVNAGDTPSESRHEDAENTPPPPQFAHDESVSLAPPAPVPPRPHGDGGTVERRTPYRPDSRREIKLPHPAGDITIIGPFPMSPADWATFSTLMGAFKTWLVKGEESDPSTSTSSNAAQQSFGQSPSDAQA